MTPISYPDFVIIRNSEIKGLYFGSRKSMFFYKDKSDFFCNLTTKVFKFIDLVIIYIVSNLMLNNSTDICILSCILIKPAKIFSFFASKNATF